MSMCLALYTCGGKVFTCPVQVFYSICARITDQFKHYAENILWKKKITKKVKPCTPPHTFLIILEHTQEDCQLKNATDFQ